MPKERMFYLILLFALVNVILVIIILAPQLQMVKSQVEHGEVTTTGVFVPTFNDYYYEYVMVDSHTEGEWQIDTYQEVKRLIDVNGQKMKDIPTGNVEYMRYFIGDDTESILFDIFQEEEHEHVDHPHSP